MLSVAQSCPSCWRVEGGGGRGQQEQGQLDVAKVRARCSRCLSVSRPAMLVVPPTPDPVEDAIRVYNELIQAPVYTRATVLHSGNSISECSSLLRQGQF